MTTRVALFLSRLGGLLAILASLAAICSGGLLLFARSEFTLRCRGQELSGLLANDCEELQILAWVTGLAAVGLALLAVFIWKRARRVVNGTKVAANA